MNFFSKNILSLSVLLLCTITMLSQKTIIDSLENKLSIHKIKDTTRVNLLNELAYLYYRRNITKTSEYTDESLDLAGIIDYKKGKARSLYIKSIVAGIKSEFELSLQYLNEAIDIYKVIDDKNGIFSCYNGMGITHFYQGDFELAITYYKKALSIDNTMILEKDIIKGLMNIGSAYVQMSEHENALFYYEKALAKYKANNDEIGLASYYLNVSNIYIDQGNYPIALESLNKAFFLKEKQGDAMGMSSALNNIGLVYLNQENYDNAITSFRKSLVFDRKNGNKRKIAKTLNNIGLVYKNKKEYKVALKYIEEGLQIGEEINSNEQIALCLHNQGELYVLLHQYSNGLKSYEKAKEIFIKSNNKLGISSSYLGIANIYFNQKKYKKALITVLKSIEISNDLGAIKYQRNAQELLSKIYDNLGDYEKAFSSHRQFKKLDDSIFNKENIKKIAELEYEYKYKQELDSANKRELKLTQEVKTIYKNLEQSQRNLLLGIIAFLLIILVLGVVIFSLKLRNIKTTNQNILIEQKLLRSQMTPHFIFNALSVLQGMILNKEQKKAVFYLSKFSKLLRITLENSRDKIVPLNQELMAVENYLALQNIETEHPITQTILVDQNIDSTVFKIPPMLIQPFVENAIEHGFENQKEDKKIDIHLKFINEELICTIKDNGKGINAQKENKNKVKKSMATTITVERLKILSKDFKVKGALLIEDRRKYNEKGTIVTLIIPYKNEVIS
ncbi:tetratricopeptide repeat-containing sensor histidine kinase [Aquimarina rhabdastrellae]